MLKELLPQSILGHRYLALTGAACAILLLLPTAAPAQTRITVDLSRAVDTMKNIIDFFELHSDDAVLPRLQELRPRFVTRYHDWCGERRRSDGTVRRQRSRRNEGLDSLGIRIITSLHEVHDREKARLMTACHRAFGTTHFQLWSEPNRTFGSGRNEGDNWLRTVTWRQFCEHAEQLYLGAIDTFPEAVICGPVLTGDDANDSLWLMHLVEFLDYWVAHEHRLDYLTMNPPYDPEQVAVLSALARGFARKHPSLGLKGIAVGEYPFFLDAPATHVRFFIMFEQAWNLLYAAKSHFRGSGTNSGLITADGATLPVYWAFHAYARMSGYRLPATADLQRRVQALPAYDPDHRRLRVLVANDSDSDTSVTLNLLGVKGKGSGVVCALNAGGYDTLGHVNLRPVRGNATIDLGAIEAGDARFVGVTFHRPQPPARPDKDTDK